MFSFARRTLLTPFNLLCCIFLSGISAQAQTPAGPIRLEVDATKTPQKILHAHLQIPVRPGPLTLYYPKWIPGEHMPTGPISDLAGLRFSAGGQTILWRRDLVDMYAFHLSVPPDAATLDVDLDFLLAAPASGFSGGASATANLDVVNWNQVLLYPDGHPVHEIMVAPSLRLPVAWKFGTALPGATQKGDTIEFPPVPLDTLVDSPLIAGRYFRAIQLTPGQDPPHEIDIVSDSAAALAMPPDMQMHFRQLVAETGALFGTRHYRDYHFLLTLSDDVAHFGLEHHESSDDRTVERSLIDRSARLSFAGLLPHEFVHSWNGKYRRPADLATPDFQQPMKDDLLWVYEGLTTYLGEVLTARSGLETDEQFHEALALTAATYEHRPGRNWRPLQDTADAAQVLYKTGPEWSNWRREVDFYEEGLLLWLDVDTTLRRLTGDKKSMNDFCRLFYGEPGGAPTIKTYTFEDVAAGLNRVAPYDWAGFLRARLDSTSSPTPSEAIANSGWELVYDERPNEMQENADLTDRKLDLMFSIGLVVDADGKVNDVLYAGPSFKAGIGPGMKVMATNGQEFSVESLKEAVDAAKSSSAPIQLLVANGSQVQTDSLDYHGGLRYPHLVRKDSVSDFLGEILHPLAQ